MKKSLLVFVSLLAIFVCELSASPTLGWRTIKPSDAAEAGVRFSFTEYEDGRIYVSAHIDPEKVKRQIDAVGFAKLMTASYLDEKKTQLIARLGDDLEKNKNGELTGKVMLHKETLANVKVWIEFGHGDGFIYFNIREFFESWKGGRRHLQKN